MLTNLIGVIVNELPTRTLSFQADLVCGIELWPRRGDELRDNEDQNDDKDKQKESFSGIFHRGVLCHLSVHAGPAVAGINQDPRDHYRSQIF